MTDTFTYEPRPPDLADPVMQDAIHEMQQLILAHYPEATFEAEYGDDPEGVYLIATVDLDDTDEVVDVYVDRLIDLQIEQGLRLHVLPIRTPERIAALFAAQAPGRLAAQAPR